MTDIARMIAHPTDDEAERRALQTAFMNTTPVVHQTWAIDGGSIVFEIRTDKPLQATAFATVGEVVASLEHLAETLAPHAPVRGDEAEETEP